MPALDIITSRPYVRVNLLCVGRGQRRPSHLQYCSQYCTYTLDEVAENAAASKIQSRIRAAKEAKEAASQKRQSLQRSSPLGKSGLNTYQGKLDELSALANELKELSERTHEVYNKVNAAIKDLKKM